MQFSADRLQMKQHFLRRGLHSHRCKRSSTNISINMCTNYTMQQQQ